MANIDRPSFNVELSSVSEFFSSVEKANYFCDISLTRLFFDLTMTSIKNLLLQTHLNQTIITLNPTSMLQFLSLLPYTGLLGTLLTLLTHHC